MLTTVQHVTSRVSCDQIFNSCAVHKLCPWCVLADGCPSDRAREVGGCGGGYRLGGVRWLGGVGRNYKSRQMAACENFKSRLGLPSPRHPGVSGGQQPAPGAGAHTVHAGSERATLLSQRHIEKAAEKKKIRSQQHIGNAAPQRYSSISL